MTPARRTPRAQSDGAAGVHTRMRLATTALALGVLVAGAAALLLASRGGDGGGSFVADLERPTPLQLVLREVEPDGTWSRDTALRAFAAAFGPLPGVEVPEGARPEFEFDGIALRMLARYWDEITAEQQDAALDAAGPFSGVLTGLPAETALGSAGNRPISFTATDYEQEIAQIRSALEARVGHPLGLPITVILDSKYAKNPQYAKNQALAEPLGEEQFVGCSIHVLPNAQQQEDTTLQAILAHEVWHCFQDARLGTRSRWKSAPPWVMEGQAMWVGEAFVGGTTGLEPTIRHWKEYLLDPGPAAGLFTRAYDAIGFYSHLHDEGIDPWAVLEPMLDAVTTSAPSSIPAFHAAVGSQLFDIEVSWAPSWFRDGLPTSTFALVNAPGILPATVRPEPDTFTISDGTLAQVIATAPLGAAIAEATVPAEILTIEVSNQAMVGDLVFGEELALSTGSYSYCIHGECACPGGSGGPLDRLSDELRVGVTGDELSGSDVVLRGQSLDDWCDTEPRGSTGGDYPCADGCGSSNGDPHLTTLDGGSYDFQAAGEFVLLRSAGGAFEVQARQEPYRDSDAVAINTALAIRQDSDRIAFYVAPGGVAARANGVETTLDRDFQVGTLIVHPGSDAIEVDAPDGTRVWVIDLGKWGLNLIVAPGSTLAASGVGLLAPLGDAGVPPLPDGSNVDPGLGYYDALYGVLANAWAVTPDSSLFDYTKGESAEGFRRPDFPAVGSPLGLDELSDVLRRLGFDRCVDILDDALQRQCAFDVAVTGDAGFVDGYLVTESIVGPEPGAPTGGDLAPLLEDVALVDGAALGPGGTLYLSTHFEDRHAEVVAIDPRGQAVKARAPTAGGGLLAFASGSLWIGETGGGGCAIGRLDPTTLDEQAKVAVPCVLGFLAPAFTAAGDSIYVVDASSPTPEAPAHLRRVDAATNELVETVPLPFANGYLRGTVSAVFYSDIAQGTYRWRPGESGFTDLQTGGLIAHPSGDGAWDQIGDEVRLITAPGAVVRSAQTNGRLVGATREAALVQIDSDGQPQLWAFPNDGSFGSAIATGPFVGSGSDRRQLDYIGDEPVFVRGAGNGFARYWLVRLPGQPDRGLVFVQWIDRLR